MRTKEEIALDILQLARNNLLIKMPFLNKALFSFSFVTSDEINFSSDGINIYYNPNYIIMEYKNNNDYFIRALLHLLLHFLFHHNIVDNTIEYQLWNYSSDICVENIINNLNIDIDNQFREEQIKIINEINVFNLNVENIYRFYKKKSIEDINEKRFYFFKDEHGTWFKGEKQAKEINKWEDMAKQVQTDLETYHKENSPYLNELLQELNRRKMTLKYFLNRFGMNEEILKTSLEDIDIMLYSYGLQFYQNVALVENQEFKVEKKIKNLVIAIDTSNSVKGELVKKFIEYTYSLLSDEKYLSKEMNLYLIQCDNVIQEVKIIHNKNEFDDYLNNIELKGFGRTDFRPVFEYVNELIRKKEINDLKGLIYFTDGQGIFPMKKQPYPTSFVIYQKQYKYIEVPIWAMKIELLEDDILDEKFD